MGRVLWEITGGEMAGGVVVRVGQSLKSNLVHKRLCNGSKVEEVELIGKRLHYKLLQGTGPDEGWISTWITGQRLAEKVVDQAIESILDATAVPIANVSEVHAATNSDVTRESRPIRIAALLSANVNDTSQLRCLQNTLESVARQSIPENGAQFVVALSWHSPSAELVEKVSETLAMYGLMTDGLRTAQENSTRVFLSTAQSEPLPQFKHLGVAVALATDWLSKANPGLNLNGVSLGQACEAWAVFGDDGLWHPQRVHELVATAQQASDSYGNIIITPALVRMTSKNTPPPTTVEEIDTLLSNGHVENMGERWNLKAWQTYLCAAGADALVPAMQEDFNLSWVQCSPRLSLFRDFLADTPDAVLAHRLCGDHVCSFFLGCGSGSTAGGIRQGAILICNPTDKLCWMMFANSGETCSSAEIAAGTANHQSSESGVEELEMIGRTLVPSLRPVFPANVTDQRLAGCVSVFRRSIERWFLWRAKLAVEAAEVREVLARLTEKAFGCLISASLPKLKWRGAFADVRRICSQAILDLADIFRLPVQECVELIVDDTTCPPVECHEEAGELVFACPSDSVVDKWSADGSVNLFVQGLSTTSCGQPKLSFQACIDLLSRVGISASELVSYFGYHEQGVDPAVSAMILLQNLLSKTDASQELLCTRDAFRLLGACGFTLNSFRTAVIGDATENPGPSNTCISEDFLPDVPQFGNYRALRVIGQGMGGSTVYLAKHAYNFKQVALKWPVLEGEVQVTATVSSKPGSGDSQDVRGFPRVLASGCIEGQHYFVTHLLGTDLGELFEELSCLPIAERWPVVRFWGACLLRRLEHVHRLGYVHGDVASHNVLMGSANGDNILNLIDFGCSKRWPSSDESVHPNRVGSMESSSIFSAEGKPRSPQDDLEALGWLLVGGLHGELPWFKILQEFYEFQEELSGFTAVDHHLLARNVTRQVASSKLNLLDRKWALPGQEWNALKEVPADLANFVELCRAGTLAAATASTPLTPDYPKLYSLLGSENQRDYDASLCEEVRFYKRVVQPMLDQAEMLWQLIDAADQIIAAMNGRHQVFQRGDRVHVFSLDEHGWFEDGIVQEVAEKHIVLSSAGHSRQVPGMHQLALQLEIRSSRTIVPKGSARVTYWRNLRSKWLVPWEQPDYLRQCKRSLPKWAS